jgi:hypothetical protein
VALMTTVQEFLDREASSWEAFDAQVTLVPADRRETPGVVGDWTLKDVVWHCAYWARFGADHLAMEGTRDAESPFTDPFDAHPDEHWDTVNAEVAEASATMSWDDVVAGADEARASLRAVVTRPGLAAEPIEWAADESWIHYDEHAEHVKAFAASNGG